MKTIVSPVLVHNGSRAVLFHKKPVKASVLTAFICSEALNNLFGAHTTCSLHQWNISFVIELNTERVPQSVPIWFRLSLVNGEVRVSLKKPAVKSTGDGVYTNVSTMLKRAKLLTPKWQRFYIRLIISPAP